MEWKSEMELESWSEYKSFVTDLVVEGLDETPLTSLWFRGQGNSDWPLISTFDRNLASVPSHVRIEVHDRMLEVFKERSIRDSDLAGMSDNDVLAVMQHHGSPTRLLDWTESPYVAAFFAFSSVGGSLARKSSHDEANCAIYLLNRDAKVWKAGQGADLIETSLWGNQRAWAQRGIFTVNRSLYSDLELFLENYYQPPNVAETAMWKFEIPRRDASLALRDLELMNITSETIFPGRDGEARYAWFRALGSKDLLD